MRDSGSLCVLGYGCQCFSVCRLRRRNRLLSFGKLLEQCDVRNKACLGVLGPHVVVRVRSGVFRGEEYLIFIVLGPKFCMAKFVKCVWMCELECWGMVLRSPVYSACGVVLMLRGVDWCANM